MTDALSQVRRLPDSRVDVAVDLGDFSSLYGNKTMLHVGVGGSPCMVRSNASWVMVT